MILGPKVTSITREYIIKSMITFVPSAERWRLKKDLNVYIWSNVIKAIRPQGIREIL